MEKIYQTNSPGWKRLFFSLLVAIPLLGIMQAKAQTITINSEPSSPLYVGDTIEVEYSSTGFAADAVFYLVIDMDSIIATNAAASGTFTATVPAGYDPAASIMVAGATGPVEGMVETKPLFGETTVSGVYGSDYPAYDAETYSLYFREANIRMIQFPGMNMVGDTAYFEFDYRYRDFADTLELVVEYSKNEGSTFTALDTLEYVNTVWVNNQRIGIPATARTGNTIMRIRQLYSELENTTWMHRFYIQDPSVYVGEEFIVEGMQPLNGGVDYTINLPYTNVTSIYGPTGDPYFGDVYNGDSIYIEADIVGFTDPIKYQVVFNTTANIYDPVYKLSGLTVESLGGDSYLYKGVMPKNIPFDDTYFFWVVPYTGSSYLHGINTSYDFALSGQGNHTINGEETIDGTYGIYFTALNVREVVTPEYIISEGGILTVDMSRRENIFSPENVDIIVEYSTDGSTYTEMGSASLNAMKVYTDGTTTFEFVIPAAAASNQTTFRIRQNDINAENLDRFYVHSYEIQLNSNKLVDGSDADYSGNYISTYLYTPVIDLKTIVTPPSLFYPGSELNLEYEVILGNLPDNTIMRAIMDQGNDIILGTSTNLNSDIIESTIPAIEGWTRAVWINAKTMFGDVNSNSRRITVEETSLEIIDVTGNPAREVDGTVYYFPGDELTVNYNLIGKAINGVQLQIQDDGGNWITIGNDSPADETITGVIPDDVELPVSPVIRLALADEFYDHITSVIYDNSRGNNAEDFMENSKDSMLYSADGYINPDYYNNTYVIYAEEGVRFIETKGFDLSFGGTVVFDIYLLDNWNSMNFEQKVNKIAPISLEYSIDDGTTWINLETVDHSDAWVTGDINRVITFVPFYNTIPTEAQSANTKFRVIQNQDNTLGFGENAWLYYSTDITAYAKTQIYSGTYGLNLQRASVSLGTLAKNTFAPGEAVTIPYNVAGNFGTDVGYAVVLEHSSGEQYVVDYSDATGQVQLATNIPVNLFETIDNGEYFDLYIYPYQKTTGIDYPVLDYMEDLDDDAEDMIALEGGDYVSAMDYYEMDYAGRRSVLTKALEQVDGDSAYLEYQIWFDENPYPTEAVFVEVTYDGGTTYTTLDTITEDDVYTIALASADITNQTHVRWVQHENSGAGLENWEIWDIEYYGSNSNIKSSSLYVSANQPATIEIEYPNHPEDFTYNLQEDVIYSGETFTLELGAVQHRPQFSDQAEYIFYLGDGSGNVIVDYTNGQDVELGRMTGLGTVDLTIPSTIFKDRYEILTTIQIDDPDSDEPFVYYENDRLMFLDIYNPTLKTTVVSKEVYRGNKATVNWEVETSSINPADYYFQLWLDNNNNGLVNEGEILFTQKAATSPIAVDIPTFANTGYRNMEVLLTRDSIYQEGKQTILDDINSEEWRDIQNGYVNGSGIYFYTGGTPNKAVSQDFDMSRGGTVEFRVTYPEITSQEFLPGHKLIFEYSQDGGATYTKLDEFPNDDYQLGDGWENQMYYFAEGQLGETVRFRMRRESPNYGATYFIDDFAVTVNSNEAPVNTISDQVYILQQTFELATIPENICRGNSFNLGYTILGTFGENTYHRIQYNRDGGGWSYLNDMQILNVTEGTGTFVIDMPENLTGGNYKFRIYSYDTEMGGMYSNSTEDEIYLIPQINFMGTTLSSDVDLCSPEAVVFYIYGTQDGFEYRARNVETGEWASDAIISDGSDISITTDIITEDTQLEIVVTALSKDSELTCATGVLNDRIYFTVIPQRILLTMEGIAWVPVEEGYAICEGTAIPITTGYYDKYGNLNAMAPTSVAWYRDDLNTAISSNTTLSTFNQSGTYFAQVVEKGCKYLTNSVDIEVLEKPEKPTIAATGETTVCGGEIVTLTANENYPYYQWYVTGSDGTNTLSGSSKTVDVSSDGVYRVAASNYPIEKSCLSAQSDPINVTIIEKPYTNVEYIGGGTELDEDNIVSCGEEVSLRVNSPTATYQWMVNNQVITSYNGYNYIEATRTGYYKVVTLQEENGVTCVNTTDSIYVKITEALERPVLTLDGDATFCAGEGSATLVAPEGFAGYWWSGHTTVPDYQVESNTFDVTYSGSYSVEVVDENGCISEDSKAVDITVVQKPDDSGSLWALENYLCGAQQAVLRLEAIDNDRPYVYQLIDMATGLTSGDAVLTVDAVNNDFVELTSAVISEDTRFGVLISDPDFEGCDVMLDETRTITVISADIEVIGNRLYANANAYTYQWYRNDEPIMGDRGTNRWIEIMDDADYKVEVTFDNTCTLMSETVSSKDVTGINDPLSENNIQLYPNPVKDKMSLEMTNLYTGELTIRIVNVAGQVIMENKVEKSNEHFKSELDMLELNSGLYFIHIISDDNKVVKSIIKQ